MPFVPMDLGDIIDRGIKLYIRNFITYVGIIAIIWVPVYVFFFILGFIGITTRAWLFLFPFGILLILLTVFGWPLTMCAITWAVSENFLGKSSTIKSAYKMVWEKKWPMIGTFFLISMLWFILTGLFALTIFIGIKFPIALIFIFVFIAPAVLLILWVLMIPMVITLEDKYYLKALWRSKKLFQDSPGKVILLIILVTILGTVVQWIVAMFILLPTGILIGPQGGTATGLNFLANLLSQLVSAMVIPFIQACYVLLYYDIRIRKEGMDLEILAKELGYHDMPGIPAGESPSIH